MKEEQFSKFLEIFRKIEISIAFTEAINQMTNYAKFLKEILSKKKKISREGIVNFNDHLQCSYSKKFTSKNEGFRQLHHSLLNREL